MPRSFNTIDLESLALKGGQATRIDAELEPGGFKLGERYELDPALAAAMLDVSRTATGFALRLRLESVLAGPCMRCLGPISHPVEVDAREVDQPGAEDEELLSPYVDDGVLGLGRWAHDAIALALPSTLLCRPDCAGLCPECGVSLNDADPAEHEHGKPPDPRWAKLREIK